MPARMHEPRTLIINAAAIFMLTPSERMPGMVACMVMQIVSCPHEQSALSLPAVATR